jgi:hypothetical protein
MSVTLFILDNVYVSEKTFKFIVSKMKQRLSSGIRLPTRLW